MSTYINYKDRMTYSECDRIIGRPTYENIRKLEHQLIANAACTSTSLGGGAHRYLGLAKSPTAYALVSATLFVRPPYPPPLVANDTGPQIAAAERAHKEAVRLCTECEAIERIMKQQIINAIDQQYLRAILNSVTRDITLHVHEVLDHLYCTYENITPQSLQHKEFEVKTWFTIHRTLLIMSLTKLKRSQNLQHTRRYR